MTAEIAIMNKSAVVLAADSAITIRHNGQVKVYGASKLFALSSHQPVGIMIYGNSEIMGVPWEVVIKAFRKHQKDISCPTLAEYGHNFLLYLKHHPTFFTESDQGEYVNFVIGYNLKQLRQQIDQNLETALAPPHQSDAALSDRAPIRQQTVAKTITVQCEELAKRATLPSFPEGFTDKLAEKCGEVTRQHIAAIFGDLNLSDTARAQLEYFGLNLLVKDWFVPDYSGVVIAGFGEDDVFPSLVAYHIGGVVNREIKVKTVKERAITKAAPVAILPFAQTEMVETFMNGINPKYKRAVESYVRRIFDEYNKSLVEKMLSGDAQKKQSDAESLALMGHEYITEAFAEIQKWWARDYLAHLLTAVEVLPREELAIVAEHLIQFASLRGKLAVEPETVGGPVDVAVISKSGGFTWVKRKYTLETE